MNVVITSFGTRGDFEPFIALAEELASWGHETFFAIPPSAVEYFRPLPFRFSVIGSGMPDIRDDVNAAWTERPDAYRSSSATLKMLKRLREYFPQILNDLVEASANASVLVSSATQPLSRIVHDLTGVPFVSVQFSHFGGIGGPALNEIGDTLVNSYRRELGLSSIRHPLSLGANSPQLALYAMSSHLIGRPPEWPRHYHITGFFFRSREPSPEQSLIDFLNSGPEPVSVCFGSMTHRNQNMLMSVMSEAIDRCGLRAVIQGKAPSGSENEPSAEIYWAESLPHFYLFARTACVVCHGGAGTSAKAFRAGIPVIFVPHGEMYDQHYWAQIGADLGCSPNAIPYLNLTKDSMTDALRACLEEPTIRTNARLLADKLQRENGVQKARQLIEALVGDIGLH